jgi:hypothetical protein
MAWRPCTLGVSGLECMVLDGHLQPQAEIEWSCCVGQLFPSEGTEEVVLFKSFCERGLALPTSTFFRSILDLYKIEVHHLTPNGVSQLAQYAHFFEAYLGIEPLVPFFQYLFRVKAQPREDSIRVVGGAGIQLRQGSACQWFPAPLKNKQDKWDSEWFVIGKYSIPRVLLVASTL